MKPIKILTIAISLFGIALVTAAFVNYKSVKPTNTNTPGKGFAVIELFTSEGCSSCPPADAAVARVQQQSTDQPVYILAFHVDYWNRLGWKDVFSSAAYSQRQNQYAQWLNLSSVYTPQIVVNGKTEFVGSEEGTLRNAIKTNLQKAAKAAVTFTDVRIRNNEATLQYHTEGVSGNTALVVALVQQSATTKVQRGENGGRTLSHVQIVRKLQSVPVRNNDSGTESIALPEGFNPQNWEVIGFLQNTSTGEILGANKANFLTTAGNGSEVSKSSK